MINISSKSIFTLKSSATGKPILKKSVQTALDALVKAIKESEHKED